MKYWEQNKMVKKATKIQSPVEHSEVRVQLNEYELLLEDLHGRLFGLNTGEKYDKLTLSLTFRDSDCDLGILCSLITENRELLGVAKKPAYHRYGRMSNYFLRAHTPAFDTLLTDFYGENLDVFGWDTSDEELDFSAFEDFQKRFNKSAMLSNERNPEEKAFWQTRKEESARKNDLIRSDLMPKLDELFYVVVGKISSGINNIYLNPQELNDAEYVSHLRLRRESDNLSRSACHYAGEEPFLIGSRFDGKVNCISFRQTTDRGSLFDMFYCSPRNKGNLQWHGRVYHSPTGLSIPEVRSVVEQLRIIPVTYNPALEKYPPRLIILPK